MRELVSARRFALSTLGLLLFCSTYGCQHSRFGNPFTRRPDSRQFRSVSTKQSDEATRFALAANSEHAPEHGDAPSDRRSPWKSWLDRIPSPPRIPLPRTDMGGNDIAVLETRTTAATAGE